jgi:hypothetical protein
MIESKQQGPDHGAIFFNNLSRFILIFSLTCDIFKVIRIYTKVGLNISPF